jgi:inner membrane protein
MNRANGETILVALDRHRWRGAAVDTTTHALFGLALARAGLSRMRGAGRAGTVALVLGSVFPDADAVMGFLGSDWYLAEHRGLTHSIVGAAVFAPALALLVRSRSQFRRLGTLAVLAGIGILGHVFLDVITSFGTMVLYPFSRHRFALDWIFIVDLWYWGILVAALLGGLLWRRRRRDLAMAGLAVLAAYHLLASWNHSEVLQRTAAAARERGLEVRSIAALPQPLSPFSWSSLVATPEGTYQWYVDLARGTQTAPDFYPRPPRTEALRAAEEAPLGRLYRWFARFPAAQVVPDPGEAVSVFFYDLRFRTRLLHRLPFVAYFRVTGEGEVVSQGLRGRDVPALVPIPNGFRRSREKP